MMIFLAEMASLSCILAGIFAWPLSQLMPHSRAALLGSLAALAVAGTLSIFGGIEFIFAVFLPLGLVLPALALGKLSAMAGFEVRPFSMLEIGLGLSLVAALCFFELGFTSFEIYKYGYSAKGAAAIVLCLAVYGLVSGRTRVVGGALLAQVAWMAGLYSENMFDVLGHLALLPVMLATLGYRLVTRRNREPIPNPV